MKKFNTIINAILGLSVSIVSSCTNNAGNKFNLNQAITTEAVIEKASSLQFKSSDLKLYGLFGSVRSVIYSPEGNDYSSIFITNVNFDKEGNLNKNDALVKLTADDNGFVQSANRNSTNAQYLDINRFGWPAKSKIHYEFPDGYAEGIITYEYSDIDDHGNWTKIVVTYNNIKGDSASGEIDFTDTETYTRSIIYYQ